MCGSDFTLALSESGSLFGWGSNTSCQLGRPPLEPDKGTEQSKVSILEPDKGIEQSKVSILEPDKGTEQSKLSNLEPIKGTEQSWVSIVEPIKGTEQSWVSIVEPNNWTEQSKVLSANRSKNEFIDFVWPRRRPLHC